MIIKRADIQKKLKLDKYILIYEDELKTVRVLKEGFTIPETLGLIEILKQSLLHVEKEIENE